MRARHIAKFPHIARILALGCGLLAIIITVTGCTPKVVKFNVTIPANSPSPTEAEVAAHQGTTHVCPGTSVELSWEVKGRGSLSATPGLRYQPPACFSVPRVPSSVPRVPSKGKRVAMACADDTIFRVTASHSFWRRSGSCPGPGCDNADHQVSAATAQEVSIGGRVGDCPNGACEVANTRPDIDWDNRFLVSRVSLAGSSVVPVFQQTPGRTLTVSHGAKVAKFSADTLTSDVFKGEKVSGTWILRLSGCASGCAPPPPALVIMAHAECSK
jgi:hypothetical protein